MYAAYQQASAAYGGTVGTPAYVDATASVARLLQALHSVALKPLQERSQLQVLPAGNSNYKRITQLHGILIVPLPNNQIGTYSSSTFTGGILDQHLLLMEHMY